MVLLNKLFDFFESRSFGFNPELEFAGFFDFPLPAVNRFDWTRNLNTGGKTQFQKTLRKLLSFFPIGNRCDNDQAGQDYWRGEESEER